VRRAVAALAAVAAAAAVVAVSASSTRGDSTIRPSAGLVLAAGLRAHVHTVGLRRPTAMAWGADGRLYVTQETGEVVVVARGASRPRVVARGFRTPLGIAFAGRRAFVSAQGTLWRLDLRGGRLANRRAIVSRLPYGRHQQDNVIVGPRGRLYFGSGSTCDVCVERDRRSAAVLSVNQDGSGLRVEARGLRNPFGLARGRGGIYVSVNNRDDLGTWEPAESIVKLRRGAHYGWPRCWPSWRERRLKGLCRGVAKPVAYLEPHSSPNGLAFWGGRLYVAEWGQYLSRRFGRKLVEVNVRTGGSRTVARGFEHPLAVAVEPGSRALLVADHGRGVVYRIARR
jgi:glucose/arabinose dehydrogenase